MIARVRFEYQDRDKLVAVAKTPEGLEVLRDIFGPDFPRDEHLDQSYMWPET